MRVLCMYTDLPGIRKWPDVFLSPPRRQSPVPCDRSRVVSLPVDEVCDICCSVPPRADWLPPCNVADGHDTGIHNNVIYSVYGCAKRLFYRTRSHVLLSEDEA